MDSGANELSGTLLQCANHCSRVNCAGFNWKEENRCQIFHNECSQVGKPVGEFYEGYYLRQEIECSSSTEGKEFTVAFMSNVNEKYPKHPDLEVWVAQHKKQGSFNVTLEMNSFTNSVSVPYKEAKLLTINHSEKVNSTTKQLNILTVNILSHQMQLSSSKNGQIVVEDKTSIVKSKDGPFVLYGVNKEQYSADAFLGIPTNFLGQEYRAVCYWPPYYACEFAVAATQDNTVVNVTLPPKGATKDSEFPVFPNVQDSEKKNVRPVHDCEVSHHGRTYRNGETVQIALKKGQALQVQHKCDLTGSLISADKPVAVWSGNLRTHVGSSTQTVVSRDHLVEQLFPIDTWGQQHVAWPTPGRENERVDYWIVTAAFDNTSVGYKYSTPIGDTKKRHWLLRQGESIRFHAESVDEWGTFSSTRPVQVMKMASSADEVAFVGDPAMTTCIPNDQFGYFYNFVTPKGVATPYTSYMTIISPGLAKNDFLLDGNQIQTNWAQLPNSDFWGAHVKLDYHKQTFSLENRLKGSRFEAYIYGSGDRESFAYPTGSCVHVVSECKVSYQTVIGDGRDNDCDGVIDEEMCDDKDNDGDGKIDEDCYSIYVFDIATSPTTVPVTTTRKEKLLLEDGKMDQCLAVKRLIGCHNETIHLKCATDEKISIVSARYGRIGYRGEMTCNVPNTVDSCSHAEFACGFKDISQHKSVSLCQGKTTCDVKVTDLPTEGKCMKQAMYTEIQYTCSVFDFKPISKVGNIIGSSIVKGFEHEDWWQAETLDIIQPWFQVNIGGYSTKVDYYAIRGCPRNGAWITDFNISFSDDGKTWQMVANKMEGNFDPTTAKFCSLESHHIKSRFIRIHPLKFHNLPCSSIAFFGFIL